MIELFLCVMTSCGIFWNRTELAGFKSCLLQKQRLSNMPAFGTLRLVQVPWRYMLVHAPL